MASSTGALADSGNRLLRYRPDCSTLFPSFLCCSSRLADTVDFHIAEDCHIAGFHIKDYRATVATAVATARDFHIEGYHTVDYRIAGCYPFVEDSSIDLRLRCNVDFKILQSLSYYLSYAPRRLGFIRCQ